MYRSVNTVGKVAHNSYLSVLVELGLIGFLLFTAILVLVARHTLGRSRWDSSFWLAILVTWSIAASTLTWEYRKPTWLFFGLLIASSAMLSPARNAVPRAHQLEQLPARLDGERQAG
jgi:O-antigen ligase